MYYRHVGPPVPRRYTNPLADLIDTIYRATLVAASHYQITVHHIDDKRLPLALHLFDVKLFLFDKTIYQSALADGTNDDRGFIIPFII